MYRASKKSLSRRFERSPESTKNARILLAIALVSFFLMFSSMLSSGFKNQLIWLFGLWGALYTLVAWRFIPEDSDHSLLLEENKLLKVSFSVFTLIVLLFGFVLSFFLTQDNLTFFQIFLVELITLLILILIQYGKGLIKLLRNK
jgi:hypothetical protein